MSFLGAMDGMVGELSSDRGYVISYKSVVIFVFLKYAREGCDLIFEIRKFYK